MNAELYCGESEKFVPDYVSASKYCVSTGGKVVEIKNEKQQNDVEQFLTSHGKNLHKDFYIALRRKDLTEDKAFSVTNAGFETVEQAKSWYEARNYCINRGGDLLTLNDKVDLKDLKVNENYWIGYSRIRWYWTSEPDYFTSYTNWGQEPYSPEYGDDEKCTKMSITTNNCKRCSKYEKIELPLTAKTSNIPTKAKTDSKKSKKVQYNVVENVNDGKTNVNLDNGIHTSGKKDKRATAEVSTKNGPSNINPIYAEVVKLKPKKKNQPAPEEEKPANLVYVSIDFEDFNKQKKAKMPLKEDDEMKVENVSLTAAPSSAVAAPTEATVIAPAAVPAKPSRVNL
ncbi:hypothetical protein HELRODRAFT_182048 [Helobdella robusta]|uniref:C-type lectin domain-containing protein n=1 Tax=Helobdella robusta TaxID=6412 RepID=T1FHN2_HELRO|nr:hypothetical protein HELRODRAFT_182048 [Helobdella robusta]ESN91870.1 hypothetical protein HELRODRAFT_182048 [Helobdella robusta]